MFGHKLVLSPRQSLCSLFFSVLLLLAFSCWSPFTNVVHAAATTAPAASPLLARTVLEVVNRSGQTICFLYISSSSSQSWGSDVLGLFNSIRSGGSQSFALTAGRYDLRAKSCDGQVLGETSNNYLTGNMTWTIRNEGQRQTQLTVVNNSLQTICYLYISSSANDSWGDDQLNLLDVIAVGERRTFTAPAGNYDLKAANCDHETIDSSLNNYLTGNMTWTVNGGY